jgi:hypothetical protein
MTNQTLTRRVMQGSEGKNNSKSGLVSYVPELDLPSLDEMIDEAREHKYQMYSENPSLANKEAIARMLKGSVSYPYNALRYLVFWPKFIQEQLYPRDGLLKNESSDEREFLTFFTTVAGIISSIGASVIGWTNYSGGNIGIKSALALNIGLFGGLASVAGDGLKSWFSYERRQAIESYNCKSSEKSRCKGK